MLSEKIQNLYSLSWKLIHLGLDGTPIYSREFSRLNGEVFRFCNELYAGGCEDAAVEEQAFFYLSLLKGYVATFCDDGDKQDRIQSILDHCWEILEQPPASLLKVRLLAWCYSETYDEELARKAHVIINTWNTLGLTDEQKEVVDELKNFEENLYPFEEIMD